MARIVWNINIGLFSMRILVVLAASLSLFSAPVYAMPRGPEADVLAMINAERVRQGCKPLRIEARLSDAAWRQSRAMATRHYFSHTGMDGSTPGRRVKDTGYVYQMVGENIEINSDDPEAVVSAWMNSPGHRQNILLCAFKETGIAMYQTDDAGTYWTQVFAMPLNLGT
jgi:uncharacterized protein YkwD